MAEFSAEIWSALSIAERLKLCRMAARDAEAAALSAEPDLLPLYKDLAAQWRLLAIEVERHGLSQQTTSSIYP